MEKQGLFVTHQICEGCNSGYNLAEAAEELNVQKDELNRWTASNHDRLRAQLRDHQRGLIDGSPSDMPDSIKKTVRASFEAQAKRFDNDAQRNLNFYRAVCTGRKIICRAKIVDA